MNRAFPRGCLWALAAAGAVFVLLGACTFGVVLGSGLASSDEGGDGVFGGGSSAVAVLDVVGTIESGPGDGGAFGGTASGQLVQQIRRAERDAAVKAIVLRVESPGGSAAASDEIYLALRNARKRSGKPIVVSMGGIAASGGYYVAMAGDRVLANRNTLTGSIGVITVLPVYEDLLDKIGVEARVFKSGPHKDDSLGMRPLDPEDERIFQSIVDDTYERFVEVVAEGRRLDVARVRQLADGRIYSARQAKDLGLIDDFGDFDDAVDEAGRLGGIVGRPRVVEYRRRGLFQSLVSAVYRPSVEERLLAELGLGRDRSLQYLYRP
ncbi:MAG: signal peptide peptidase SppA [Chloroflexi bacterium]|nr:signal peptide peptidase SppA [Chloroflexota bacterium]